MTYQHRLFDSITNVPDGDWDQICTVGDANAFTSRRFLHVVEQSLGPGDRMWHVILYQADGRPVACATMCTYSVDLCLMASPWLRRLIAACRRPIPRLGTVKLLFCGIPVSVGQSPVVMVPAADAGAVLCGIDDVLLGLARQHGIRFVVYKEFPIDHGLQVQSLLTRGYRQAQTPSMHACAFGFDGLDSYCAELKAHYRADIRRSQKKFAAAGATVTHLRSVAEIERAYTPDVHRLYEAVVLKSAIKLELLPREFFLALARQFPGQCSLTTIYKEQRIIAFNWGLLNGDAFHFVFCGIDYAASAECDLYFNLMYHQLDYAFRSGARKIELGQTADAFKARLGARPQSMFAYVRGLAVGPRLVLRAAFNVLFPRPVLAPVFDIFKAGRAG